MKDTLIDNPITELYNSLFNMKDKMTSAEWVEISGLIQQVYDMKTIIKWKTEKCSCCPTDSNDSDSSNSDSD